MTDDELVIRHVRLCECGRVADHDGICAPTRLAAAQRLDDERDEVNAERARARHERRQRAFDAERRAALASIDGTLSLHHLAVERVAGLSAVAAGQVERSRGGSASSGAPPAQQMLDDDPRWAEHWRVIRSRLLRVHELIDEARGHGTVAGSEQLIGVEKQQRVIEQGRGLSPAAVVEELGRGIADSASVVRGDRIDAGVCVKTGLAPGSGCTCVVCRHWVRPRANCDCGICRHEATWSMPSSTAFVPVPARLRAERKAAGVCLRDGEAPRPGCACIVCRDHWPTAKWTI